MSAKLLEVETEKKINQSTRNWMSEKTTTNKSINNEQTSKKFVFFCYRSLKINKLIVKMN